MDSRGSRVLRKKEDIIYLLSSYLKKIKVYVKDSTIKTPVILNLLSSNEMRVFLPVSYKPRGNLVLYSMFGRYIEFELELIKRLNLFSYLAAPVSMLISSNRRYYDRYYSPSGLLLADNFKLLNRNTILNPYDISLSVRNMLNMYETELRKIYPSLTIGTYSYGHSDKLVEMVYTGKNIIVIEDIYDIESYFTYRDGVLDKAVCVDDRAFLEIKASLMREGLRSVLLYPLVISLSRGRKENIAYIKLALDKDFDLFSMITHFNVVSYEITSKIKQGIMSNYSAEQRVINLGMGGIKLFVDDFKLNSYFNHNDEISFDLSVGGELQEVLSLSFHGNLVYRNEIDLGSYMGFVFTRSERKGFDRLETFIKFLYQRQRLEKL